MAKALEAEKKAMEQREKRAQALRDLADAMKGAGEDGPVAPEAEALDRKKNDEAAKKLAEAMGKALEKMTPEERKRLADKLKEMAKEQGKQGHAADADQMKDLADSLSTPEGQKKLEDELKDLAKQDDETDESKRQKQHDDAEDGADGTQKDLGKQGNGEGQQGQGQQGQQGQGQQGQGQQGQGPQGQGEGQQGQGQGQQGQGQGQQGQSQGQQGGVVGIPLPGEGTSSGGGHSGHDVGTGDHAGSTSPVDAQTLKSRAHGPLNKGQAMPGSVTTYVPGRAGGTANTRGSGDLRVVGPHEVDGVERSDVPEEYREQVRQYFQP